MGRGLFGIVIGVVVSLASIGPTAADWLEPRKQSDCYIWKPEYGFSTQRDELRSASIRCVGDHVPWEHSWRDNMACGVDAMSNKGPVACAPIEKQRCSLNRRVAELSEQCEARYDAWRLREAAEKKRREDEERAMTAAEAAGSVPSGGAIVGHGIAGATGGGQQLSDAITNGALPAVNEIQKNAIGILTSKMDNFHVDGQGNGPRYTASHPRPSRSQKDRVFGILDEASRVGAMQVKLPLGEYSIVGSAYAGVVTQIVEAQANGEINASMAAIGIAVASWVAWEAAQAELQLEHARQQGIKSAARDMLPRQQQVARETREAVRSPAPEPDPEPVSPDTGVDPSEDFEAPDQYADSSNNDPNFQRVTLPIASKPSSGCGPDLNTNPRNPNASTNSGSPYGMVYNWIGRGSSGYIDLRLAIFHESGEPAVHVRMTTGPNLLYEDPQFALADTPQWVRVAGKDFSPRYDGEGVNRADWLNIFWNNKNGFKSTIAVSATNGGCEIIFSPPDDIDHQVSGIWNVNGTRIILNPERDGIRWCWPDGANFSVGTFSAGSCVILRDDGYYDEHIENFQ
ncbi:hypothetical protein NA8A_23959 [Nitratireductor indicus C115]|uniref:Uncharacterized protein n=2 Tax=Nitratireductor indicus TaxID=721133 RepID=K2NK52_9HYPH|nr:hypothetical protein [Nitratireductor indicus]EKF39825.1 hypothetical protein NA8A_23959 [Nitratireductor indicus C115]SFQ59211.1 hypothetical protein SAMN05216176_10711 [Nitratireductor indicus]